VSQNPPRTGTNKDGEGTTQTICPYCQQSLATVTQVTQEHVIPSALGGSETVPACRSCNSAIGHTLEARLLGPTSWLTVIAQAAGFTPGWVNVTYEGGQRAREHFGSREGRLLEPDVEVVEETNERLTLGLTIPSHIGPGYVDHIIRQQAGRVEQVEHRPAPPKWATVNLSVNVDDLASLAAKAALCAGALHWGDAFLASELGDWLRRGIDDPSVLAEVGPPALPPTDAVNAVLSSVLAHYVATNGATPWRSPLPSMTILTPVDHGRATVVVLALFGTVLTSFGNNLPKPGRVETVIHFHPFRSPDDFQAPGR
jgi:hypothetical protein